MQVDGDGQHDPRFIHELLARLCGEPGLNMVTGSRFLEPSSEGYRSSAARRVGIRLFSRVVSLITRRRVSDPTSGFRMTDRRGIKLFARDYPHDYPEIEAILLMHAHRLNSCEIPVVMRPRHERHLGDLLHSVGLLHGEGAAGRVRGAVPRAADGDAGAGAGGGSARHTRRGAGGGGRGARVMTALAAHLSHTAAWALTAASRPGALQLELEEIAAAVVVCGAIFELVRRKRLMERYAILWLLAGATVLVLVAGAGDDTERGARRGRLLRPLGAVRDRVPVRARDARAVLDDVSRLSDQNTALAQRVALLQQRLEGERPSDTTCTARESNT